MVQRVSGPQQRLSIPEPGFGSCLPIQGLKSIAEMSYVTLNSNSTVYMHDSLILGIYMA